MVQYEDAAGGGGAGDVSGPTANVTDEAIARWAGTGGGSLQNSLVLIDDSGNITGIVAMTASGLFTVTKAGPVLDLQNTSDAASNQVGILRGGNRATPVDGDEAYLSLTLEDDTGAQIEFGRIIWVASSVNNLTPASHIAFEMIAFGTTRRYRFPSVTQDSTISMLAGNQQFSGNQTYIAAVIVDGASASLEVPNATGGRTVDANGEVTVDTTPTYGHLNFFSTQENVLSPLQPLSIVLENPTSTEDIPLGFFDEAITIRQINDVVVGSTPSLTWNIYHATTKDSTAPNKVFSSDRVTTSTSGAESLPADTNRDDDTIPAGSWVWFESSAESGTTDWFVATISITVDA